jgi:hypothetical protein
MGRPLLQNVTFFALSLQVPQQKNEYDCGLFVLYFIQRFMEEAPERLKKKDLAMVIHVFTFVSFGIANVSILLHVFFLRVYYYMLVLHCGLCCRTMVVRPSTATA